MIEPDGSATVRTGPDGSQRSFALGADELRVLEAELEAADLDAVEDRPTGCADCFHYEISYGGTTVGYDEIIEPPQSVAAVVSHLAALVDEHAPAEPVASEARGSPGRSSRLVDRDRRPGERIRDRWLRLHRRPTDRATERERRQGAGPGSLRRIGGSGRGLRRRGGSRRPRRPRRDRCRRQRLHDGIPPRSSPRDLGPAGGLHPRQRRRDRERARRLPRGRRRPLRPLQHRGGVDRRQAASHGRRDGAAAPRFEGSVLLDQGARRARRACRRRARVRNRRPAPAVRLGTRRHDAAAVDHRDGRAGQVRVDRRRAAAHGHHPRRQRRRGPARRRGRGRPGEAYFVTDGDRVVFRDFVSALLETQRVEPPTPLGPRVARRRGRRSPARRPGGCCRSAASRH